MANSRDSGDFSSWEADTPVSGAAPAVSLLELVKKRTPFPNWSAADSSDCVCFDRPMMQPKNHNKQAISVLNKENCPPRQEGGWEITSSFRPTFGTIGRYTVKGVQADQ